MRGWIRACRSRRETIELTAVFAGASALLLVVGGLVSLLWLGAAAMIRRSRRDGRPGSPTEGRR